jgi:hypothetical protein
VSAELAEIRELPYNMKVRQKIEQQQPKQLTDNTDDVVYE